MSDRKGQLTDERIGARMFRDPDVLAVLDTLDEGSLRYRLGSPRVRQSWERSGWDDRQPRPALASDDPAVVCAIARCATFRAAQALDVAPLLPGRVHPSECGWCSYPLPELLRALSWATWASGHMESEALVWEGADGSTYLRQGGPERWEHPAWAAFAALTPQQRTERVLAAVEASRS